VQVVESDVVGPKAEEALLDLRAELFPASAPGVAAFRGDHASLRSRRQRLPDPFLAPPAGVDVGGVDVLDADSDSLP
jgi:hypothetical protein